MSIARSIMVELCHPVKLKYTSISTLGYRKLKIINICVVKKIYYSILRIEIKKNSQINCLNVKY